VKWQTGISILSLSLSSLLIAIAGFKYSAANNTQSSSVIIADSRGQASLLDTLLPAGDIGLIDTAEPLSPEPPPPESPSPAQAPSPLPAAPPAPKAASPCININTADQAQLIKLKGIGPAMSANIIEYRTRNGPFRKLEDIQKVKGIGPAKFAGIAEMICL